MKKRKKYNSFGEFVLNDREVVIPFLLNTSMVFSVIIFGFMVSLAFYYDLDMFFKVLFSVMLLASFRRIYKHIKFGGNKVLKKVKMNANEVVWNKYED